MRLNDTELSIIKKLFKHHFSSQDELWLFGSRADNTKKGGDIDLYIETYCDDLEKLIESKKNFWCDLQKNLGEQKIDIVVKRVNTNTNLLIYKIAREEGIKLI